MFNEPVQHTALLNNEMKNPHLVETTVIAYPVTGKLIEVAPVPAGNNPPAIQELFDNKTKGLIPRINVDFNIQGIPLLLTTQSYLIIQLVPSQTPNVAPAGLAALPRSLEIDTSAWPKLNSSVIENAKGTFSNFGVESRNNFFINYQRSLEIPEELRANNVDTFSDCYVQTDNAMSMGRWSTRQSGSATSASGGTTPYTITIETMANNNLRISPNQTIEIKIPLSEILPIFQIPVLPIAQTNTSNIALSITMFSPRHIFPIAASFRSADGYFVNQTEGEDIGFGAGVAAGVWIQEGEIGAAGARPAQGEQPAQAGRGGGVFGPTTFIAADALILNAVGAKASQFISAATGNLFRVDCNVNCWMNLKVLTDPMLNPLVEAYIRPFITPANEFRAQFSDAFTYTQTYTIPANGFADFFFAPSQLFYNTTKVGVYFVERFLAPAADHAITNPGFMNAQKRWLSSTGAFIHGHMIKRKTKVSDFQIGLSSSCTPLFSEPLTEAQMKLATEDCFKKYRPLNMIGSIVQNNRRCETGDAFYLFDLSHTEGAGYFIDADNMITVRGKLYNPTAEEVDIQVILCLFYQNSFTVLLELDGAVLVQQS